MEKKRTFSPSIEANEYLDDLKRGTLSDFINNLIELLAEKDIDYLELRDRLVFYDKYKPLTDQLESRLYSGQLMGSQTIQAAPAQVTETTQQVIEEKEPELTDEEKQRREAQRLGYTLQEYVELEEKAKSFGYDIESYLDMKKMADDDEDDFM